MGGPCVRRRCEERPDNRQEAFPAAGHLTDVRTPSHLHVLQVSRMSLTLSGLSVFLEGPHSMKES